MPIVDIDNSKQIEFGYGDVRVAPGLYGDEEKLAAVCFFNDSGSHEIGDREIYDEPKHISIEETPVRMIFEKIESIDVVINALEEAKKKMLTGDVNAR